MEDEVKCHFAISTFEPEPNQAKTCLSVNLAHTLHLATRTYSVGWVHTYRIDAGENGCGLLTEFRISQDSVTG